MRPMTVHFSINTKKEMCNVGKPMHSVGEFHIAHVAISQTGTKEVLNPIVFKKNTRMVMD